MELVSFLNESLKIHTISDSSLNGVQIEGADVVTRVAVAVDAGLSVIEESISAGANFLLVHHGLFWGGQLPIIGNTKKLVAAALQHGLTLYAAHLPLDAHTEWGNNYLVARMLELTDLRSAIKYENCEIACIGRNTGKATLDGLTEKLSTLQGARLPLLSLDFGPKVPENVCIVTGSGSDALWKFAEAGFDTLVTGEPRQLAFHFAKENKLNVIFGGHYATETVGVLKMGKVIENRFGVPSQFIHQPTGI